MAAAGLMAQRVGRFRLVQQLGRGSTGEVFLATHVGAAGREVALKILDTSVTSSRGFRDRLERDVREVSKLSHPHILPVYEYGTAGETAYVAMPVVRGGSLRTKLLAGRLAPKASWRVLRLVGEALKSAHQAGVVHADVKPGNVLFDVYGRVLLTDFGLARTHFGFALGTPGYMAPEVAEGAIPDERADVYALAVMAFEMLAGSPAYGGESPAELLRATVRGPIPAARERRSDVPAGFDGAVYRGLVKDPSHRYRSVAELLWALAPVLEPRPRRVPRLPRWRPDPRVQPEDGVFVPAVLTGLGGQDQSGRRGLGEVEPGA
jgi:eukaryotic-like serine/threonine-protein kinase